MLTTFDDGHAIGEATERAEFARSEHWPGMEFYRANLRRHAFAPHVHEGFGIGVIESGIERFDYRGRRWRAPAGSLILMNPDTLHTGQADDSTGWCYRMVYVEPGVLRGLAGHDGIVFADPVARDARLAARLLQVLRALWSGPPQEALAQESALSAVLLDVVARHACPPPRADERPIGREDPRWHRLVDWIDAHAGLPITLQQLAAQAGIGRFHLVRSVRSSLGITPMTLVRTRRLLAAKRALAAGGAPADVAHDCGFTDQAHLTHWLRRTHGVTPAQYQRQLGTRRGGRRTPRFGHAGHASAPDRARHRPDPDPVG